MVVVSLINPRPHLQLDWPSENKDFLAVLYILQYRRIPIKTVILVKIPMSSFFFQAFQGKATMRYREKNGNLVRKRVKLIKKKLINKPCHSRALEAMRPASESKTFLLQPQKSFSMLLT